MAKLDLKSAYRMVPVHQDDHHLLGIQWCGVVYYDKALPFGLRSAPKIFTAVADALAWAMTLRGITYLLQYLDDFFFCSPPGSPACQQALQIAIPLCSELGFPTAPEKTFGPATIITFLGIEIDSVRQELRLPQDKLVRLQALVHQWSSRRHATKHQLQVLLGHLNHAVAVVKPGRTFTRSLIRSMSIPRQARDRVRLDEDSRSDILWWHLFLERWNGVSFFPAQGYWAASVTSDASGSWGCGAFLSSSAEWFQVEWPPNWSSVNRSSSL